MRLIAVVDAAWGIAREGRQVFTLAEDLAFFKRTTLGGVVVMGRKTLAALPGGRPLPGRENIVLTRQAGYCVPDATVCHSLAGLPEALADYTQRQVFVIGGGEVYRLLLPYCRAALVTKVFADGGADTFLPNLDEAPGWRPEGAPEVHAPPEGPAYAFCRYQNLGMKKL